jgi:hypothetical protein
MAVGSSGKWQMQIADEAIGILPKGKRIIIHHQRVG